MKKSCAEVFPDSVARDKKPPPRRNFLRIMSCNCKFYQRRVEKLRKKYGTLRRNHKKLLGVTVLLTDAIEQFVKGEMKPGINDILVTCSTMYPDLFEDKKPNGCDDDDDVNNKESVEYNPDENGKVYDPAAELEREYYEGFMARPRIPRSL